jgi:hypothetical protein
MGHAIFPALRFSIANCVRLANFRRIRQNNPVWIAAKEGFLYPTKLEWSAPSAPPGLHSPTLASCSALIVRSVAIVQKGLRVVPNAKLEEGVSAGLHKPACSRIVIAAPQDSTRPTPAALLVKSAQRVSLAMVARGPQSAVARVLLGHGVRRPAQNAHVARQGRAPRLTVRGAHQWMRRSAVQRNGGRGTTLPVTAGDICRFGGTKARLKVVVALLIRTLLILLGGKRSQLNGTPIQHC